MDMGTQFSGIGNPNPSEVGMFAGPQPQVQTWVSEASPALLAALPPRHGLVVGTRPSTPGKGRPSTGPSMPRGMYQTSLREDLILEPDSTMDPNNHPHKSSLNH